MTRREPAGARGADRRPLGDRLPVPPAAASDILDRFLAWVEDIPLRLYPAQEQAVLELLAGRHVFLGTPTGSGKSLAATFLHFMTLCRGERSFYTSPTKALASEKFFALCGEFGAERVGMLTGDAAINREAPVICCTAEVLANVALRSGTREAPVAVVMDEFHFYSDAARGVAWQVPLLALPETQFLLMSATMGDTSAIERHLQQRTGRTAVCVSGSDRPVPLDYTWRETPIQATVAWLVAQGRVPAYIVHFTHRDCAETAQALCSLPIASRSERQRLGVALRGALFDTPYGRQLRRLLGQAIAVHHAGLLPKYRLLVEQLAQQGLLKIVCGTDTLGVGVNIPIRTVVFARLAKFDGRKVRVLAARDFRQIAGRAGRKGFDDRGSVVCQAPPSVIEALRRRAARGARPPRRAPTRKGEVIWNRRTFEQLIDRPPERMASAFGITHGMILHALARTRPDASGLTGYRVVVDLVARCHEPAAARPRLLHQAARHFRSLRRAGLVEVTRDARTGRPRVVVSPDLQDDFSLDETLSLYLVDAVAALDHDRPDYGLDVVSLVEAILEDPKPVLASQQQRARAQVLAALKADGVPYEERQAVLETVTYPQPLADYIWATFDAFAARHPWVSQADIGPKSIAREMLETGLSFNDYVSRYRLERAEGVLLRHLNQVYRTLEQSVPLYDKTERLLDEAFALRAVVARVDASLAEEWRRLLEPASQAAAKDGTGADACEPERRLAARVRAEMRLLLGALARRDYLEAERCLRCGPGEAWDATRIERAMAAFHAQRGELVPAIGRSPLEETRLWPADELTWHFRQTLPDAEGHHDWAVIGRFDLADYRDPTGPMVTLVDIRAEPAGPPFCDPDGGRGPAPGRRLRPPERERSTT